MKSKELRMIQKNENDNEGDCQLDGSFGYAELKIRYRFRKKVILVLDEAHFLPVGQEFLAVGFRSGFVDFVCIGNDLCHIVDGEVLANKSVPHIGC